MPTEEVAERKMIEETKGRKAITDKTKPPGPQQLLRRGLATLLCVCLLAVLFSACGEGDGIFRADLSGPVENLDPQFATSPDARMIIYNIFEGLVLQDDQGEIHPGVAYDHQVSAGGLVYTFHLRQGLYWEGGEHPLTAHDFVFAFRRMFNAQAPSPYASSFFMIENAQAVLQNQVPVSGLGVRALDDHTLEFRLEHASAFFLELLASSAAMPCNEDFFNEARARYGLGIKFVAANGPFRVERWDNTKYILLRQNSQYVSEKPTVAQGVNLYIDRTDPVGQFSSGKADLVVATYDSLEDLRAHGAAIQPYDKTVWCIVFNQRNDSIWADPLLRQGLGSALDREMIAGELTDNYTPAGVFVPPAVQLVESSYRELAGYDSPLEFEPARARRLYNRGLSVLPENALPATTLTVPEEGSHFLHMGMAQQSWQKHLSAYVNLEAIPARTLEERYQRGDYELMLLPFSPTSPQLHNLLDTFSSDSTQNYCGYLNPRYDDSLLDARDESTVELAAFKYWHAESLLLLDAVVVPLYFETTYYATGESVQGVQISPFAGKIYYKYATRN